MVTPNNSSVRYVLVQVEVPKGKNGMVEIARGINEMIHSEFNYNCNSLLMKAEKVQELYEEALQAFQNSGNHIHVAIKKNIDELVTACKGHTWFEELDKMSNVDRLFRDGKPSFILSNKKKNYNYFFKHASIDPKPFTLKNEQDEDGETLKMNINGKDYLMYNYTFEFNPSEGSPNLQFTLGDSYEDYLKTVKWVKTYFAIQAGWGIPSCGICHNEENVWYDLDKMKMGIEGNFVYVLAPHISEYNELTIKPVVKAKMSWVEQHSNVNTPVRQFEQYS